MFFSIVPKHIKFPFLTKQISLDIRKGKKEVRRIRNRTDWLLGLLKTIMENSHTRKILGGLKSGYDVT